MNHEVKNLTAIATVLNKQIVIYESRNHQGDIVANRSRPRKIKIPESVRD